MFGTNLSIEKTAGNHPEDATVFSWKDVSINIQKPYPNFPVSTWESGLCKLVWEGYCYTDQSLFQQTLQTLQAALLRSDKNAIEQCATQCQQWSGEFACWMIGEQGVYFFNDALGRLPVYTLQQDSCFLIGRNLHAFFQTHSKEPDALAIAQTLWCGYALADKTLFNKVHRVAARSFLYFSFATGTCVVNKNYPFDVSARNSDALSTQAAALSQCFKQACSRIADTVAIPLHLSLSGGQDSRAVLAGMQQVGANLSASSFSFSETDSDASIAALLAKKIQIPWKKIAISASIDADDWLIQLKSGLNYSGMAFIESYLRQVSLAHPDCVMLTGDGGDKLLPYLGEAKMHSSEAHLVLLLERRHAIVNAAMAAKVCGLHIDDLRHSILDVIRKYPEQSLMDKSIHFTIFERGAKAYFEGEDRNRFFMWSTTPFYDLEFFNMAMAVPDEYKKNYTLYRHFMQLMAPEVVGITDAGGGTISSRYFKTRKWVQEQFRSASPVVKQSLRSIKQMMQSESSSNNSVQLPVSVPASLHFLDKACFEKVVQKGGQEAALHLRTILKTFA